MALLWSRVRALGARTLARDSSKRLAAIVLFAGALAFMGLIVARDWQSIVSFPWRLRWDRLAALVVVHLLASNSLFVSWHLMMRRLAKRSDWRTDFYIYSVSILARRIPSPVWYIGGRLYLYQRPSVPAAVVLSATGLEAMLIGLSGTVCYVLLLPWYTHPLPWLWPILLAIWAALMGILIIRPNLLLDLGNLVLRLLRRPQLKVSVARADLALWALVYLSTWFLDGMGLYFTVSALVPTTIPVADVIGVSTVSALVALATLVLPGGLGLKELAMGALLSQWLPMSTGLVISIFYRVAQTLIEAVWALAGLWIGRSQAQGDFPGERQEQPKRSIDL